MSETPRQAALLARLFDPDAAVRGGMLAGLIADPVEAASAALGPHVRARLADDDPVVRLAAAEYLWRVSGDPAPAAAELCSRFRHRLRDEIDDGIGLLRQLGRHAVGPLLELARSAPQVFDRQPDEFHRWAARTALTAGPPGVAAWVELLGAVGPGPANTLLVEFAELAPKVECDDESALAAVRAALALEETAQAAGAALWRATWRVNRDWLHVVHPADGIHAAMPEVLKLVTRVMIEHLGRRPDLAPLARAFLVRLAARDSDAAVAEVRRLARLGDRGWAVLLLVLQDSPPLDRSAVPGDLRAAALREALGRSACLPLVQHHAHRAIAARLTDVNSASVEQVKAAAEVLTDIGSPAATALADVLRLIVREPQFGACLSAAAEAVAPGYPLARAAVVRALNALDPTAPTAREAFGFLARVLHHLDPDAGPNLVGDTAVADHAVSRLLDLGHWQNAPPDVRARHAGVLADLLASPRAAVRTRAAAALRHYLPELPAVWPAMVAALTAKDESPAGLLLPYFRALAPVADAVALELEELFADPNTTRAARAGVALWRVRRWERVAPRLREAVRTEPPDGRAWTVIRGMAERVRTSHGLLEDLGELIADAPESVAAQVRELLAPAEPSSDRCLSVWLRPEHRPVEWGKVREAAEIESRELAPPFVLAVMCGFGTEGWSVQKIWLIKNYRERVGSGLAEAKAAVERVAAALEGPSGRDGKRAAVREFFPTAAELPAEVRGLLEHPSAWFRWAGLELADAWGLLPREMELWVEDRRRDASPLVRERAAKVSLG